MFIGIDLGTTHCALFFADSAFDSSLEQFNIPQLIAPGQVSARPLLPSFVYTPHQSEFLNSDRALPWGTPVSIVGQFARELGGKSAGRLVQSAKSWLCHSNIKADECILPLDAVDEVEKLSPLNVTQSILEHLVQAWDHVYPNSPLAKQEVVITVPASFDPAARTSTELAIQNVGIQVRLIEEPIAAFYAWLSEQDNLTDHLKIDDEVLIIDVGGGTTDLSLIKVTEVSGQLNLERTAVGRHILLGGDNMDAAITYHLAHKLSSQGTTLEPWQISGLTQACREAKERLLIKEPPSSVNVVVPSRGRSLFANKITIELTADELDSIIIQGFFPSIDTDEIAQKSTRSAIRRLNLDYEFDPAITRHINEFIITNAAKPTKVLLNGGVFNADKIQQVLCERLSSFMPNETQWLLNPFSYDQAVSKGACFYARIQQVGGLKVKSGLATNYFIGVESPMPAIPGMAIPMDAICIAPKGMEEGGEPVQLNMELSLIVGEKVDFQFFSSTDNGTLILGAVVPSFQRAQLNELNPISVLLDTGHYQAGELVRVYLTAFVSDLGVLKIKAHDHHSELDWSFEYQVRTTE